MKPCIFKFNNDFFNGSLIAYVSPSKYDGKFNFQIRFSDSHPFIYYSYNTEAERDSNLNKFIVAWIHSDLQSSTLSITPVNA